MDPILSLARIHLHGLPCQSMQLRLGRFFFQHLLIAIGPCSNHIDNTAAQDQAIATAFTSVRGPTLQGADWEINPWNCSISHGVNAYNDYLHGSRFQTTGYALDGSDFVLHDLPAEASLNIPGSSPFVSHTTTDIARYDYGIPPSNTLITEAPATNHSLNNPNHDHDVGRGTVKAGLRFPCTFLDCNKDFGRKGDRDRHLKKHSPEEAKFFCFELGCKSTWKPFYRRDKLVSHQRNMHGMHRG